MVTVYGPAFAWLPTRMECGRWVWFRAYQSIDHGKRKRLYGYHTSSERGMSKHAGPIETVGALSEALKGFSPDTRIFGTEVTGLSIYPQNDGALLVANHRSSPTEKAASASVG